jgi:hypothetical protein
MRIFQPGYSRNLELESNAPVRIFPGEGLLCPPKTVQTVTVRIPFGVLAIIDGVRWSIVRSGESHDLAQA